MVRIARRRHSDTDYVRALSEQIRPFLRAGRSYTVLGTDGFGRSDTRANPRSFFEVDRYWITHAAINALVASGQIDAGGLRRFMGRYHVDPEKPEPWRH